MKLYVKRVISIAHHLPNYDGLCRNVHGHTLLVEVWIEGEVNPETGMVVDFKKVKNLIDVYDHTELNFFLDNPTVENFVNHLRWELHMALPSVKMRVRVWESEDCYAEVGDEI